MTSNYQSPKVNKAKYVKTRPLSLHVEDVEINPDIELLLQPSYRVIDIEMNVEQAREVKKALDDYLDNVTTGTIRIRYTGRAVS